MSGCFLDFRPNATPTRGAWLTVAEIRAWFMKTGKMKDAAPNLRRALALVNAQAVEKHLAQG
ncbi:hypothetical protein LWS69_34390, partial [Bordetella hinzii]|nr:hypothetical protein [Bordetella hinzii]